VTDPEDDDNRSRALAHPRRASARPKPQPPSFADTAPATGTAIGRVPVAKVPASEVLSPQPDPPRNRTPPPPPTRERREAPERPPTASPNVAPVLTKLPPPFTVRLSQFLWVLSLLAGGVAVVYLFVIREDQVPLITEVVKGVAEGRSEETYTAAAVAVTLLLIQIVLLVSFSNRKPNARWWQLATVVGQIGLFLLSSEFFATGEHGPVLRQVLFAQWSLALLALLFSSFRGALQWTARKYDVRRAGGGEGDF
jgi:drug/metabolite transporter (DMT)-like permease